ncbi:cytochrome c oxidase subunit II [Deinococcus ficus]|jgi:cytochrome c oxidase subunit 2|uniref:cytochrome c oxidase subunit II n=1 Tax=Deinococcus ficus TaxID=317577 RepID=UPI0003B5D5FF|nr:cytochrome c oxidase subunit II [Deinococcus ficus]
MTRPDPRTARPLPPLTHHTLHKYENIWLALAVVMTLLLFVGVLASMITGTFPKIADRGGVSAEASTHSMGISSTGRVDPTNLNNTPFATPGLVENADGSLDAWIVAGNFVFQPNVLRVPAGVPVTLHVTSSDVVHGFQVTGTNLNTEILPGHVATMKVTFRHPGEQHIICNEYCGRGHQDMITRFIVETPKE